MATSLDQNKNKKLELEYPCEWEYRVIIDKDNKIDTVVDEVIDKRESKIKKSNKSKNGNYQSYLVSILVHNDDDRTALYDEFKKNDNVKMVL